jgi:hypothetical protein
MPYEYEENFPLVLQHLNVHHNKHTGAAAASPEITAELISAAAPSSSADVQVVSFAASALPEMVLPSVASASATQTSISSESLVISEQ